MRIVSFRYDPLQFAPNFRANFAESGKTFLTNSHEARSILCDCCKPGGSKRYDLNLTFGLQKRVL